MNKKEMENYKERIEELTSEELELVSGGVSGVKKGLASALAVAALGATPSVNAQSKLSINNTWYSYPQTYCSPTSRCAYVGDIVELKKALGNSSVDYIILTRDLDLKESITFPSDRKITLDLGRHNVYFLDPSVQFIMGDKYTVQVPYTVYHEGYWKENKIGRETIYEFNIYGEKIIKGERDVLEKIWVPPYTEVEYKDEYRYSNDAELTVKNGKVIGCNGKDGLSRHEVRFFKSSVDGQDGQTPAALFKAVSGKLYISGVELVTGKGGNGGDAFYSTELHIPIIGSGNGGDGGDGGNGGDAFEAEECEITTVDVSFKFGEGGKGGKGSKPNPSAWLISGSKGEKGHDGTKGNYGVYNLV